MHLKVFNQKSGTLYQIESGATLLDVVRQHKLEVHAPCGGKGTCKKCKVEVDGLGTVLACKTKLEPALWDKIGLPHDQALVIHANEREKTRQKIVTDHAPVEQLAEPLVRRRQVTVPAASLQHPDPDAVRFADACGLSVPSALLNTLHNQLQAQNGQLTVDCRVDTQDVLRFVQPSAPALLGVAVDLGTTTLAAYLYDLTTGQRLAEASALNPQKAYGADVISRIDYALQDPEALKKLQAELVSGINGLITELCAKPRAEQDTQAVPPDPEQLMLIALAGNTTMMHLLSGLNPAGLAKAPFVPVSLAGQTLPAATLGIRIASAGLALLLPSIASYVGADITAGILACNLDRSKKKSTSLLLDIGTNGEIVLATENGLVACATAAGPAFEGANISCGMPAQRGAIDLAIFDHNLKMRIIGPMGTPVRGLCGSGLVALIASLLDAGVIDETGRLCDPDDADHLPDALRERLVEVDGQPAFRLSPQSQEEGVYLTQRDIRELQNAKAAMAAGVEILLKQAGLKFKDLDRIYLAGGFGSQIKVSQAIRIGLLPPQTEKIVQSVGNTSAAGAALCLLQARLNTRANKIARKVRYFELSSNPQFSDLYIDAMMFPEPEDDEGDQEGCDHEGCNHDHHHTHHHDHQHGHNDHHDNHHHDHHHDHQHDHTCKHDHPDRSGHKHDHKHEHKHH